MTDPIATGAVFAAAGFGVPRGRTIARCHVRRRGMAVIGSGDTGLHGMGDVLWMMVIAVGAAMIGYGLHPITGGAASWARVRWHALTHEPTAASRSDDSGAS